jgi:hypothetical protein
MRSTMVILAAAILLRTASADAAEPLWPEPGAAYSTSDTVTFQAVPAEGEIDRDYWFVFSKIADFTANQWFALGGEEHELEVDIGWLATKFDHLGLYWWALCPVSGPDFDVDTTACSEASDFSVRFRLDTLTRARARSDVRWVMSHQFRDFWRGTSGRSVSCRRSTRTRQRCTVSAFAGDVGIEGTIRIRLRRNRTWSESYFRGRVTLTNEYCHVVNQRPLSECQTTRRRSGRVYDL